MEEVRKGILVPGAKISIDAGTIINIMRVCEDFHVLPEAGGLYDQDSLFVYMMYNYLIWQQQRAELDSRKSAIQRHR
jgi:hypothetical protein